MEKEEAIETINKMLELSAKYRGRILEACSELESLMEMCIAYYFTSGNKEKSDELRECFLASQMAMFNTKRTIICYLINKFTEEEKEQTKNESIKIKLFDKLANVDSNMQKISAIRNICAHRKLRCLDQDVKEFDEKTIFLIGTEKQNPVLLNEEKVLEEVTRVRETIKLIEDFYSKLIFLNQRV